MSNHLHPCLTHNLLVFEKKLVNYRVVDGYVDYDDEVNTETESEVVYCWTCDHPTNLVVGAEDGLIREAS